MSELTSERKDMRKDEPRPDAAASQEPREWDTVVKRISDRIRGSMSPQGPSTQQSMDLAGELVRLERRALEAEANLARERDQYAIRVKEMEEKLRKLEPWLRRLRTEFQEAATERDRLKDELTKARAEPRADAGAARETEQRMSVLAAEREAAVREGEAAKAARDAALAEAETLRTRLENDLRTLQESWRQRIEAAEQSRDKAVEELKALRSGMNQSRRTEEDVKRLLKQVEQLETTTAAHKAVARASQEEAESLKQRLSDAERAAQKAVEDVRRETTRAEEAVRALANAVAEAASVRSELVAAQGRIAELEGMMRELREELERTRTELGEKDRVLGGTVAEAESLKRTLEKVRAEVADARGSGEHARAESLRLRHEMEQIARDAERDRSVAQTELRRRDDDLARVTRDAAEQRELAEEALRSEEQARTALAEAAERFAAEQRAHEETRRASQDAEQRLEAASHEIADARRAADELRAAIAALESERANLSRALEEERESAARRFEAAEASWRSQMHAAEGRFGVEISRERQRAAEIRAELDDAAARHAVDIRSREADWARQRSAAADLVRRRALELADSIAEALAVAGEVAPVDGDTTGQEGADQLATMEVGPPVPQTFPAPLSSGRTASAPTTDGPPSPTVEMSAEETSEVRRVAAVASATSSGASPGGDDMDWDRVLADVEALRTEVEGLQRKDEDTASISLEEAGAAEVSATHTAELRDVPSPVAAHVQPNAANAESDADLHRRGGRRGRRR